MSTWFRKEVGDGIDAAPVTDRIHDLWQRLVKLRAMTMEAAVFSRYDLRANVVTRVLPRFRGRLG
jgi:hypothetical protein